MQGKLGTDYPVYDVFNSFDNNSLTPHVTFDWYDENPVDKNTSVTFKSNGELSDRDQRIAAAFAANIINAMRRQIGAPQVKASLEGLQLENQMVEYQKEHHAKADAEGTPHMIDAIDWLADSKGIEVDENFDVPGNYGGIDTVADLKNYLALAMQGWINEMGNPDTSAEGWRGHYDGLIGKYADGQTQTVGISVHVPTEQEMAEAEAKYHDENMEFVPLIYLDLMTIPSSTMSQHYISLDNNGLSD